MAKPKTRSIERTYYTRIFIYLLKGFETSAQIMKQYNKEYGKPLSQANFSIALRTLKNDGFIKPKTRAFGKSSFQIDYEGIIKFIYYNFLFNHFKKDELSFKEKCVNYSAKNDLLKGMIKNFLIRACKEEKTLNISLFNIIERLLFGIGDLLEMLKSVPSPIEKRGFKKIVDYDFFFTLVWRYFHSKRHFLDILASDVCFKAFRSL